MIVQNKAATVISRKLLNWVWRLIILTILLFVATTRCAGNTSAGCNESAQALPRMYGVKLQSSNNQDDEFEINSLSVADNISTLIATGFVKKPQTQGWSGTLSLNRQSGFTEQFTLPTHENFISLAILQLIPLEEYAYDQIFLIEHITGGDHRESTSYASTVLNVPESQESNLISDFSEEGIDFRSEYDVIVVTLVCHDYINTYTDYPAKCLFVQLLVQTSSLHPGPDHFTVSILKQYDFTDTMYLALNKPPFQIKATYDRSQYGGTLVAAVFGANAAMAMSMFPNQARGVYSAWLKDDVTGSAQQQYKFEFDKVVFNQSKTSEDKFVYFMGSANANEYAGLWSLSVKLQNNGEYYRLDFQMFSDSKVYKIDSAQYQESVKFIDVSWHDPKEIFLLEIKYAQITDSEVYLWDFSSGTEELYEIRTHDGYGVWSGQRIICDSDKGNCQLVLTGTSSNNRKLYIGTIIRDFDGSLILQRLLGMGSSHLFPNYYSYAVTYSYENHQIYFSAYYERETAFGQSFQYGCDGEVLSLLNEIDHSSRTIVNPIQFEESYNNSPIPQIEKQAHVVTPYGEFTEVTKFRLLKHETDYDDPLVHESWYDSACILNVLTNNNEDINFQISYGDGTGNTNNSGSQSYQVNIMNTMYHSSSCPDKVLSVKIRIKDSVGEIPVQEFIDEGFLNDEGIVDSNYIVVGQYFMERLQNFDQDFNIGVAKLAYQIYNSFQLVDPDEMGKIQFDLDVTDTVLAGLQLFLYVDIYTSWQFATAGPIQITIQLPTIEIPPDFTDPPSIDQFFYLEAYQQEQVVLNVGGIRSFYGLADSIYMQVFYRDTWMKTLAYASMVPLSLWSTLNTNIYTSVNAAYSGTSSTTSSTGTSNTSSDGTNTSTSTGTNDFIAAIYKNDFFMGVFPVSFMISEHDVQIIGTYSDAIFDFGLFKVYEFDLSDQTYTAAGFTSSDGTYTSTSSTTNDQITNADGTFVQNTGYNQWRTTQIIDVQVMQEVIVEIEIELQSSVSSLQTSYMVKYMLRRKITRQKIVYVDQTNTFDYDNSSDNTAAGSDQSTKTGDQSINDGTNPTDSLCSSVTTNTVTNADDELLFAAAAEAGCFDQVNDETVPADGTWSNTEEQQDSTYTGGSITYFETDSAGLPTGSQNNNTTYETESDAYLNVINEPTNQNIVAQMESDIEKLLIEQDGDLNKAIAVILEIQDENEAIDAAQSIAEIEDDTDLDAQTKFDIFEFMKVKGITSPFDDNEKKDDVSYFAIQQEIQQQFVLPIFDKFSKTGILKIKFSSEIKKQPFSQILYYIKKEQEMQGKGNELSRRNLQEANDQAQNQATNANELEQIESLFKLAGCIKLKLLPGDENNLDKKGYIWKLKEFDDKKLILWVNFDHPEFISLDEPDSIQIQFTKAYYFMQPVSEDKLAIPDKFSIQAKMPMQSKQLMLSDEQVQTASKSSQAFVLANVLLQAFFQNSMQILFGSIICLQILAHLPLANIQLPANAQQAFDIMIEIVSFDYFPISEIFDFGFSETEPWSLNFALLGYESINFIEGMGSIILFMWIGVIYIAIVCFVCILCKTKRLNKKCLKRFFDGYKTWYSSLGFLHGVFFESMVCVSVGMRSFQYFEYFNASDRFSIANHIVVLFVLVFYLGLITYFTIFRMSKLVALYQHKQRNKNLNTLEKARQEFKSQIKTKKGRLALSDSSRSSMLRLGSLEANSYIDNQKKMDIKLAQSIKGVKKADYKLYKPFYQSLRMWSKLSLMSNLFIMIRRLILLYTAMFLAHNSWLQVIIFCMLSINFIAYLGFTHPYKSKKENKLMLFNEVITCLVAYLVMSLEGLSTQAEQHQQIGNQIIAVLYFCWFSNGLVILIDLAIDIKKRIKRCCCRKSKNLNPQKAYRSNFQPITVPSNNDSQFPNINSNVASQSSRKRNHQRKKKLLDLGVDMSVIVEENDGIDNFAVINNDYDDDDMREDKQQEQEETSRQNQRNIKLNQIELPQATLLFPYATMQELMQEQEEIDPINPERLIGSLSQLAERQQRIMSENIPVNHHEDNQDEMKIEDKANDDLEKQSEQNQLADVHDYDEPDIDIDVEQSSQEDSQAYQLNKQQKIIKTSPRAKKQRTNSKQLAFQKVGRVATKELFQSDFKFFNFKLRVSLQDENDLHGQEHQQASSNADQNEIQQQQEQVSISAAENEERTEDESQK